MGHDCLNSNEQVIRIIYDNMYYYRFKYKTGNLLIYTKDSENIILDLDHVDVINNLPFQLFQLKDQEIETYLDKFSNLVLINLDGDKFKISNKVNDCQMLIDKSLFLTYCSYYKFMEDQEKDNFTIDVEFDEVSSKYFTNYLMNRNCAKLSDLVHFEHFIDLCDYFDVNF